MSEPITPEWLVELGGERYEASNGIGPHVEFISDDRMIEVGDSGHIWYSQPPDYPHVWLANIGTRAEFLALMTGMKWPVNERPKGAGEGRQES